MENQQIYPSKVRIVPNCKLAKVTANLEKDKYQKLLDGKKRKIIEKKHKKYGEILSTYTITNADGYDGTDSLNTFDYAVLSACISEQEAGNTCTTPAVILRAAILNSIRKLMSTVITVNLSDVNEKLSYNDGKKQPVTDTILPCRFITVTINGQPVEDAIYFDRQSPIFKFADERNQIIRYDVELLDVSKQQNTPLVITLKNYVMLRVMEIIKHKMTPTLTLADIFKKSCIDDKPNYLKLRARETVEKFFEHLQKVELIKNFTWTKKGNKFYSVKFTF